MVVPGYFYVLKYTSGSMSGSRFGFTKAMVAADLVTLLCKFRVLKVRAIL